VRVRLEIGPKEVMAGSAVLAVAAATPGQVGKVLQHQQQHDPGHSGRRLICSSLLPWHRLHGYVQHDSSMAALAGIFCCCAHNDQLIGSAAESRHVLVSWACLISLHLLSLIC
jgi:hypothetical protein